jgi:transcriptional regulator with XRE-family HTH domain
LGKVLRRIREERKLTVAEVARRLHISQPALSRIEGGRNAILTRHVYHLCEVYGIEGREADSLIRHAEESNQTGWWESYGDVLHNWFEIYAMLEADASEIWTYESEFIPGLTQTADYARAVTRAARPDWPDEVVNRTVDLRLSRQNQLNEQGISAVVNEAVVRRTVGGRGVMRSQLEHLVELITSRTIDLRVLAFDVGAHPAMNGAFAMLRFPDTDEDMDLVYTENERGATYLERPEDLVRYSDVFERVRDLALPTAESADLLTTISRGW